MRHLWLLIAICSVTFSGNYCGAHWQAAGAGVGRENYSIFNLHVYGNCTTQAGRNMVYDF